MSRPVVVVEDDPRYRAGLVTLLEHTPGLTLAAAFATAEDFLAASATPAAARWRLVLMDVELPGCSGVEALRRTRLSYPTLPVVMLTAFEEPALILEAICAGADGYLLKRTPPRELVAQLAAMEQGGAPLTAGVARTVLALVRGVRGVASDDLPALTGRERDVLAGLVRGGSYKSIAADLGVSVETIRTHIKALYRKLQVSNVAAAVSRAVRAGMFAGA